MRLFIIALLFAISYAQTALREGQSYVDDYTGWGVGTSTCGSIGEMVGGYNVMAGGTLEKEFFLPSAGCEIRLQMTYVKIDTWDNEWARVKIDDTTVWEENIHHSTGPSNECGTGSVENQYQIDVTQTITTNDLTIQAQAELNSGATDESFGIKDIQITVNSCPEPLTSGETYTDDLSGWNVGTSECGGNLGTVVGGYNVIAGGSIEKTYNLPAAGCRVRVELDFIKIDSWDSETALVQLNGETLWQRTFDLSGALGDVCGAGFNDDSVPVDVTRTIDESYVTVSAVSNLDSTSNDESMGIQNIRITPDCPESLADHITYHDDLTEWSVETSTCGTLGTIVGGYNVLSGGEMTKTYNLPQRGCNVRVQLDYVKIDTWDDEQAEVQIDGESLWSSTYALSAGDRNVCGRPEYNEHVESVDVATYVAGNSFTLSARSNLNSEASDESFGIQNVYITPTCHIMLVDHVAYEDSLQGWNVIPSECGDLGTIVGGVDNTYNNDITKSYDLPMTECSVRIQMEFIKMDTWDDETATVTVNNQDIWSEVLILSENSDGAIDYCGRTDHVEDIHVIDETITVPEDYLEIHVTTTLNQAADDEAFGIRNVIITPDCATPLTNYQENTDDLTGWNVATSTCGAIGQIVGGYNVISGGTISKRYSLPGDDCKVSVGLDYVLIDSWDNEQARVNVNGETIWEHTGVYTDGPTNECGGGWNDNVISIEHTMDVTGTLLTIGAISTLDSTADDESFGIKNIVITPECGRPTMDMCRPDSNTYVPTSAITGEDSTFGGDQITMLIQYPGYMDLDYIVFAGSDTSPPTTMWEISSTDLCEEVNTATISFSYADLQTYVTLEESAGTVSWSLDTAFTYLTTAAVTGNDELRRVEKRIPFEISAPSTYIVNVNFALEAGANLIFDIISHSIVHQEENDVELVTIQFRTYVKDGLEFVGDKFDLTSTYFRKDQTSIALDATRDYAHEEYGNGKVQDWTMQLFTDDPCNENPHHVETFDLTLYSVVDGRDEPIHFSVEFNGDTNPDCAQNIGEFSMSHTVEVGTGNEYVSMADMAEGEQYIVYSETRLYVKVTFVSDYTPIATMSTVDVIQNGATTCEMCEGLDFQCHNCDETSGASDSGMYEFSVFVSPDVFQIENDGSSSAQLDLEFGFTYARRNLEAVSSAKVPVKFRVRDHDCHGPNGLVGMVERLACDASGSESVQLCTREGVWDTLVSCAQSKATVDTSQKYTLLIIGAIFLTTSLVIGYLIVSKQKERTFMPLSTNDVI